MKILRVRNLQPLMWSFALNLVALSAFGAPLQVGEKNVLIATSDSSQSTPVIKGFHPIKKALAPLEKLESQGLELEQTIMKLTGPISELSPTMTGMDKTMTGVLEECGRLKLKIGSTYDEVSGARKDIAGMRRDVHSLKSPVLSLRKPIEELATPLSAIKRQLNIIAWAIVIGGLMTAFGIPISCVLFWKYRSKLIPQMLEPSAAPAATPPDATVVSPSPNEKPVENET